jgi:hypothetical protein
MTPQQQLQLLTVIILGASLDFCIASLILILF